MRKAGFTLIELLIVVAIIGILAAIAVPNFLNAQTRAQIARIEADAKSTATALEQYRLDQNAYPVDATNRNPIGLYMLTTPVAYMSQLPLDVFVPASYFDDGSGEAIGPFLEMGTDTGAERQLGTWSLSSAGPDADDDVQGQTSWPWGTVFWEFDPTNGLHSNGDIMKYGGNYASGAFTRNGKPNR